MADTGLTVWAAGFWPDDFWAVGFWAGGDAPPTPATPTQTPAGSSRTRKRLYVEVDGQQFPVNDASEALHLLQRARALAEKQAEEESKLAEKRVTRAFNKRGADIPRISIPAPEISASPEIRAEVSPVIADIKRLYKQAAELSELRLRLAKKMAEDDDEDDEFLLML